MSNNDILIKESKFISKWRKEMMHTLQQMHPNWSKDDIKEIINDMLEKSIQNPDVTLDNNYTGESRDTKLISVFDWVLERKPIIAGNGTFYKNQDEAINPIASMVDGFLIERKRLKKEMFKVEDKTSDRYKDLDRAQLNQKILANS